MHSIRMRHLGHLCRILKPCSSASVSNCLKSPEEPTPDATDESLTDPFLSPPFVRCPNCGAEGAFGVLMVNRRSCIRRCASCRHTQSQSLPPAPRKLIYLDQLALSNLAKARARETATSKIEKYWRAVLDRLLRLGRLQLIACPRSNFHEEEGMVWAGYHVLRAMARLLSAELAFHDYAVIRNGQLYEHCQLWEEGRGTELPPLEVNRVVDGDPHGWQPRLLIDVRMEVTDQLVAELDRARETEDAGLRSVWARWAQEDVPFDRRVEEEASSYGPIILELIAARVAAFQLGTAGVGGELINESALVTLLAVQSGLRRAGVLEEHLGERAAAYLGSVDLVNVPFNYISSLLYAALARRARAGQKGVTRGMTNDIRMMSTFMPFVHGMFIDSECHTLLNENPLPERVGFETRLFSHRNKNEFVAYLDEIEAGASQKHLEIVAQVYGDV